MQQNKKIFHLKKNSFRKHFPHFDSNVCCCCCCCCQYEDFVRILFVFFVVVNIYLWYFLVCIFFLQIKLKKWHHHHQQQHQQQLCQQIQNQWLQNLVLNHQYFGNILLPWMYNIIHHVTFVLIWVSILFLFSIYLFIFNVNLEILYIKRRNQLFRELSKQPLNSFRKQYLRLRHTILSNFYQQQQQQQK